MLSLAVDRIILYDANEHCYIFSFSLPYRNPFMKLSCCIINTLLSDGVSTEKFRLRPRQYLAFDSQIFR
jgi:hypothetical protein